MGKDISLEEMKKIEIDILTKIDKVCKENNLKYSLMDGSLIGLVRHKGFIPWDDDIDIMMPRPDYEKLREILINNPIDGMKYMSSDTQEDFYYPFAKVVSTKTTMKEHKAYEIKDYGVFVDIFPIDGIYKSKIKRYILLRKMRLLRNLIQISFHDEQVSDNKVKKYIKNIFARFAKKIGFKRLVAIAKKNMKKCEYATSENVTLIYNDIFINKNKYYTKDMFEKISYRSFENEKILSLDNYDRYLTDLFGDYMKLPPKESQKSNHSFDRLKWKD